ncbi:MULTISPECIES: Nramp family divalent metal transporter [Thermococcus]|jgi:Mn2+/Fe2+ NRAMP family transporter|uniref:Natural resistance-associated macrophage protein n=1 Tax=Thermococcus sibiricus TaxID=172049 RepID=A0A101EJR1_9EURY|nr:MULTISPECIES: Nramp family divalent metal transporter [Thermococcus]KUK16638.1 MAG: Natural resistance-associated macrophage protein [Thermococcus sibiricus]MBC7095963.1 Nramp family divalent metal transporter [Thermococcus sp.]
MGEKASTVDWKTILKALGPGLIVTAAFVGPGTVTTTSSSGAKYGYVLLWALTFSVFATIVLQEMSARIAIATGKPLAEFIRTSLSKNPTINKVAAALVVLAIGVGNAAFQTGNLTGAAIGLNTILGNSALLWLWVIAIIATILLWTGSYKIVEKFLTALVVIMGFAFLIDMFAAKPDWGQVAVHLVKPSIPEGALTIVLALIGTTVVPYNLFLHSSSVLEKGWKGWEGIKIMRWDAGIGIFLGGLFSWAIMITAAATLHPLGITIKSAGDMAIELEPLLGKWAAMFFALGLFAAGMTSAVTAPLAGAYAIQQSLGLPRDMKDKYFRLWLMLIMFAGLGFGTMVFATGRSPIEAIIFAQAVNGVLLPIVAWMLLYAANKKEYLGEYTNGPITNVLGGIAVITATILGIRLILKALGLM